MSDIPAKLIWTHHALRRVAERFGPGGVSVPKRVILKAALDREVGDEYRVRRGDVYFVCLKHRNGVLIKTVFRDESGMTGNSV